MEPGSCPIQNTSAHQRVPGCHNLHALLSHSCPQSCIPNCVCLILASVQGPDHRRRLQGGWTWWGQPDHWRRPAVRCWQGQLMPCPPGPRHEGTYPQHVRDRSPNTTHRLGRPDAARSDRSTRSARGACTGPSLQMQMKVQTYGMAGSAWQPLCAWPGPSRVRMTRHTAMRSAPVNAYSWSNLR